MKNIVIVGAGGFGREVLDTLRDINKINSTYKILGFFDDNRKKNSLVSDLKVLGNVDEIKKLSEDIYIVLALGNSETRKQIVKKIGEHNNWETIIHPTAIISNESSIGKGSIIQAFCLIASKAKVGNFIVMNAHSGCGHDTNIGAYCSIMSFCDIAGDSILEDGVFMGSGSKVIPNISVKENSYLCAGSVIMKSILVSSKLIGNPGKVIEVFDNGT
jgi:sugar O-acyltransferase (sialic acid O-acetyltransferase NeuD family)